MPKASSKAARATRGSPRKLTADLRCLQCPDLPLRSQCPHSAEGREFLDLHKTSEDKPTRAPQRCTKCPDRPLRTECIHTQAGRLYLQQQEIRKTLPEPTPNANNGVFTPSQPHTPTMSPLPNHLDTHGHHDLTLPTFLPLSLPTGTNVSAAPALSTISNSGHGLPVQRSSTLIPIDPFLSPPRCGASSNTMFTLPPLPQGSRLHTIPPTPQSSISTGISDSSTPLASSSMSPLPSVLLSKKKYQRPTRGNPKFGYVQRAMRGPHEFHVLRRHSLPSPSKDSATASKDFLEGIHRVLEKAEDVAVKTGCWLFLGAQHPGATGGTVHYSSARLVRDAPDEAEDTANNFNALMSSLLRARRADALDASKKLDEAVQQNAALQSEVHALKDVIKQYSMRLEARDGEQAN